MKQMTERKKGGPGARVGAESVPLFPAEVRRPAAEWDKPAHAISIFCFVFNASGTILITTSACFMATIVLNEDVVLTACCPALPRIEPHPRKASAPGCPINANA